MIVCEFLGFDKRRQAVQQTHRLCCSSLIYLRVKWPSTLDSTIDRSTSFPVLQSVTLISSMYSTYIELLARSNACRKETCQHLLVDGFVGRKKVIHMYVYAYILLR